MNLFDPYGLEPVTDPTPKNTNKKELSQTPSAIAQRIKQQKVQAKICELKEEMGCYDCGIKNPAIIEFHHEVDDPSNRNFNKLNTFASLEKELKKGKFLCRNCHGIRHIDPETGKVNYGNINFR
jgi:hypothetical protein